MEIVEFFSLDRLEVLDYLKRAFTKHTDLA
jgi:hypothetical protein